MDALDPTPPRAVKRPVMFQDWRNLTFLHWRYSSAAMARLLPSELQPDLFDGTAWLGLTPFCLRNLHPPGLPSIPWLSHFPETNVRTYVRGPDGEPGIWFFSLEASRALAVLGGRLLYSLPYRHARMRVTMTSDGMTYESTRASASGSARTSIVIQAGAPIAQPSALEVFLTARFRLYAARNSRLLFADVEHEPWPLSQARIMHLEQTLTSCLGLPGIVGDPLAHYSPGVRTKIGWIRRV